MGLSIFKVQFRFEITLLSFIPRLWRCRHYAPPPALRTVSRHYAPSAASRAASSAFSFLAPRSLYIKFRVIDMVSLVFVTSLAASFCESAYVCTVQGNNTRAYVCTVQGNNTAAQGCVLSQRYV